MRKRLKRMAAVLCVMVCIVVMAVGCGGTDDKSETKKETEQTQKKENVLEDGIYTADFKTDSSMFHVSEACKGKGTLTVKDGEMTIHISLTSKNIVNLYPGLAEDAQKEGAELLEPTVDTVTYDDGLSEEVYGYDVPVPELEKEFDLALIGTKGNGTIIRSVLLIRKRPNKITMIEAPAFTAGEFYIREGNQNEKKMDKNRRPFAGSRIFPGVFICTLWKGSRGGRKHRQKRRRIYDRDYYERWKRESIYYVSGGSDC